MTTKWQARIAVLAAIAALLFNACGSATPSPSPAGSSASSGPSTGADASVEPSAATDDPGLAAQQELELVRQERNDAGMPALIGTNGQAAFDALDAIEAEFGRKVVQDAAAIVDTGTIPAAGAVPTGGRIASIDGTLPAAGRGADAIDLSVFAETGFTASALMQLFTGLVERAAENNSGTLPSQDHFDETADGLRQQGVLNTTMAIQTGGGKVHAELTLSATDNITDAATGSFVALYTSTSTGVFELDACPDSDGIAAGTYSLTTKHELNNVSGAVNAQSAGGHSAEAPFSLVDGDDAHLVEIRANVDLGASSRGPGTAGGPGPTNPFDWSATQAVQLVIPAHGAESRTEGAAAVTGTGGAGVGAGMSVGSFIVQLFLTEVAKEGEKFWRSGKCIDLKPSDDTRDVKPGEEIDLTVEAKQAFTGADIASPITAKFSGKASLTPTDQPVDPPAHFSFKAGPAKDDVGTIDLKQTSKRGIGMRQVVFTVRERPLKVQVDVHTKADAGLAHYDTKITLNPLDLTPGGDGGYTGHGTVHWTTTLSAPKCKTKTYGGSFGTDVTARIDPDNPDRVLLRASFIPGQLHPETLQCGKSFPFTGSTDLGVWATTFIREVPVDVDRSLTLHPNEPLGSATMTIKVTRPSGH